MIEVMGGYLYVVVVGAYKFDFRVHGAVFLSLSDVEALRFITGRRLAQVRTGWQKITGQYGR